MDWITESIEGVAAGQTSRVMSINPVLQGADNRALVSNAHTLSKKPVTM